MDRTTAPSRPPRPALRPVAGVAAAVALAAALAGCGSDLLGPATTTPAPTSTSTASTTSTTAPLTGEVAVAWPVTACQNGAGGPAGPQGTTTWKPSVILAPIPTALVGKVAFYSDGVHTVLAPTGWTCVEATSPQGATELAVYPSQNPAPPAPGAPTPGTEGVYASFDTTGHTSGVALVCPFFTIPSWQARSASCPPGKPPGEQSTSATPDIVAVTDPSGVAGSLPASGGSLAVTGVVLFPQTTAATSYGSPAAVAAESCALSDPTLCPTVLSDFEVREFPVPVGTGG